MNAAARLVHQHVLSRHLAMSHRLTRQQSVLIGLLMAIMLTAICIIYVTQVTRILNANYQHDLLEQDHLRIERGQLLLERSTWMMPARIQQLAENKLGMMVPNHDAVVIIHE